MSGQTWPTQTESWPGGTGLTRCVCVYMCVCTRVCVCVCVDWKPARKQVNKGHSLRHGQQLGATASGPRLETWLWVGAGRLPSALSRSEPQRWRARGQWWPGSGCGSGLPALSKGSLASALRALGHSGLHTPGLTERPGPGLAARSPQGPLVSWPVGLQEADPPLRTHGRRSAQPTVPPVLWAPF